jgi:hypothetical protein
MSSEAHAAGGKAALRAPLLSNISEEDAGSLKPSLGGTSIRMTGSLLPAEAPPPVLPFELHSQSLKNLVSAGLDMKNKADFNNLVQPLMDRCGGSIQRLALLIGSSVAGGLRDSDDARARRAAFGENRLPEKELVRAGGGGGVGNHFVLRFEPPRS